MKQVIADFISDTVKKDEAPFRKAWMTAALVGVCGHYSPAQAAEIIGTVLKEFTANPGQSIAKQILTGRLGKMFGFAFDYALEAMPEEEVTRHDVALGPKPDPLTLRLLKSREFQTFTGLSGYPRYVEEAERLGIIDADTFHGFANLVTRVYVNEIREGIRTRQTEPGPRRGEAREALAAACCDVTAVLTVATLHLIHGLPEVTALGGHVTLEALERLAPQQMDSGRAFQVLSMLQNSCLYLLREADTGVTPRDYTLACLERQGFTSEHLREQLDALTRQHPGHIPFHALPEAYQQAMHQVQREILPQYTESLAPLARQAFALNARINRRASHPAYSGDKLAFSAQMAAARSDHRRSPAPML